MNIGIHLRFSFLLLLFSVNINNISRAESRLWPTSRDSKRLSPKEFPLQMTSGPGSKKNPTLLSKKVACRLLRARPQQRFPFRLLLLPVLTCLNAKSNMAAPECNVVAAAAATAWHARPEYLYRLGHESAWSLNTCRSSYWLLCVKLHSDSLNLSKELIREANRWIVALKTTKGLMKTPHSVV